MSNTWISICKRLKVSEEAESNRVLNEIPGLVLLVTEDGRACETHEEALEEEDPVKHISAWVPLLRGDEHEENGHDGGEEEEEDRPVAATLCSSATPFVY